jgi:hypothetical protein
MTRPVLAIASLCGFLTTAHAGEAARAHRVSITTSPFRLLNPEAHLTGELRLSRKFSIAAMMGAGTVSFEGERSGIFEVGGQFRYYLLGAFPHGFMLGADAGYVYVNPEFGDPVTYLAGAHAGGFLGYKYSMEIGLTGEFQIGPVYLWGRTAETTELQTLINLNVGWSF